MSFSYYDIFEIKYFLILTLKDVMFCSERPKDPGNGKVKQVAIMFCHSKIQIIYYHFVNSYIKTMRNAIYKRWHIPFVNTDSTDTAKLPTHIFVS